MKLKEYKEKLLLDAFSKRLEIPLDGIVAYDQACSECQEELVFALKVGDETVSLGLTTVLQLLKVAELEGYVPNIGTEKHFWVTLSNRYPQAKLSEIKMG
ncbi:MAG: hypothetical protein FWG63_11545 [Defluviitaleaceae bacterium]|nr:hypothetical protein [Defluviitaleaceae bacterium]